MAINIQNPDNSAVNKISLSYLYECYLEGGSPATISGAWSFMVEGGC